MLQKKSAFDVLMNKNRNAVSPSSTSSSAASAATGNFFSPIKATVSDAASPVQKENDPPTTTSSSAKKDRNLLEEIKVVGAQSPTSVLAEAGASKTEDSKNKFHKFFQKKERPLKASVDSDSSIILDATPEVVSHPPIHVHQYTISELDFQQQYLTGLSTDTKLKLKPPSENQELKPDFVSSLLSSSKGKHPFFQLSWNGRLSKELFPECKCSMNVDIEISQINKDMIYDVNIDYEMAMKSDVKIRKRNFDDFKKPVSPKPEPEEEETKLDDSQVSKDGSMLGDANQPSNLDTSNATTDQENEESPMPTRRSSKRRRTDSTPKPQPVAKLPARSRLKKSAKNQEKPAEEQKPDSKNDVSVIDLSTSIVEPASKPTKKGSEEFELWTEKYQFKNENEIVTNNSQFERLKEWLNNWKQILSKESNSSNTKKGKKSSGYDSQFSDSDYTYDSDYSNADSMCSNSERVNGRKFYSNAILLTGPHGSGKTSSIYSIAKILGFKVFEVNASSSRCKSQILQELDGALNSHHISSNSKSDSKGGGDKPTDAASIMSKLFGKKTNEPEKSKNSISNFFKPNAGKANEKVDDDTDEETDKKGKSKKKRKASLRKETLITKNSKNNKEALDASEKSLSDTNSMSGSASGAVNIQKESLILFDEIDVVFKEDVNFWAAVNYFIKKSKKPIILTTTDDYLQDKINLNVEKVEFIRPRIDSSIKYLKTIASKEKINLETSTAYKILRQSKCDMRRALIQMQALVNCTCEPKPEEDGKPSKTIALAEDEQTSSSTTDLSKYLDKAIQDKCVYHMNNYFDNLIFLDLLSKQLKARYLSWNSTCYMNDECPNSFKRFDTFILRDGLTDSIASASATQITSSSTTGDQQQVAVTITAAEIQNILSNIVVDFFLKDDLCFSYSMTYKDQIDEIYKLFIYLFNGNKSIDINDWLIHGTVYRFNYTSNTAINKFAQATYKFTSNPALSLDYRPYLQKICQCEELKQQAANSGSAFGILTSRRRFMHYLAHLNVGLVRDDFSLLSKSNLISILERQQQAVSPPSSPGSNTNPQLSQKNLLNHSGSSSNEALKCLFNGDIFSDDN